MSDELPAWPEEMRALQRILAAAQPPEEANWDALLPFCVEQNLLPVLYKKAGALAFVPDSARQTMRNAYMRNMARMALLQRDLARFLGEFNAAGVPILLLKGGALAAAIYPDPALRPMVDVDVLIKPESAEQAMALARAQGFAPQETQLREDGHLEFENEIAMLKPSGAMSMVEFHWSLFNSPHHQQKLRMEWFWQTALPIAINNTPALMLGREAQLAHLCSHLMLHHKGYGLLWWNDIFELLKKHGQQINWALALEKSKQFDLVLPLQYVCLRLADEWSAPIPAQAVQLLKDAQPSAREAEVYGWLTAPQKPPAQRLAADLRAMSGWRARIKFALSNLFPPPSYMRRRYRIKSAALLPIAYLNRWVIGVMDALKHKP